MPTPMIAGMSLPSNGMQFAPASYEWSTGHHTCVCGPHPAADRRPTAVVDSDEVGLVIVEPDPEEHVLVVVTAFAYQP